MADVDELVLDWGAHRRPQDGMCVMEAVSFLAGEPFSDHPERVSRVVGAFLRRWNDELGDAERQALKRYLPPLAGTGAGDEEKQAWLAADWLVRELAPAFLRLVALGEHAGALEALPALTGPEQADTALPKVREGQSAAAEAAASVRPAGRDAQRDPVTSAAWATAWEAARAAGWSAAGSAMWAVVDDAGADPAWTRVGDAARVAAWDACRAAAWSAASEAATSAPTDATGDAVWAAARDAARTALRPAVEPLRASAFALLDRMLVVG